jgi:hypothetical protein
MNFGVETSIGASANLLSALDTMDERALEKLRMEIKASETDERTKEKGPPELGR